MVGGDLVNERDLSHPSNCPSSLSSSIKIGATSEGDRTLQEGEEVGTVRCDYDRADLPFFLGATRGFFFSSFRLRLTAALTTRLARASIA